ncbi:MAG: hypothetical protein ACYTCU_08860 [Planctomycetota bacterium]|jgi:hypothetical protein
MKHHALRFLLVSAVFCTVASAQTPTWRVEFLGPPPGELSSAWPVAVNDDGLVTGNGYLSGWKRAWVATPGEGLAILPLPDDVNWSEAYDINSSGVIAGQVLHDVTGSQAVLWTPGPDGYEAFLLPSGPDGGLPFHATGINDAGDVVGKYGVFTPGYVWNETDGYTLLSYTDFPVTPGDINEQRQIIGDTSRMDIDTMVLEELGNPTGTTYGYMYTKLGNLNDAGECTGYAVTATSGWPYLPVRYTDGPTWKVFSSFPHISANAMGIAASGDTVFHLGIYGTYVYVNGVGSIALENTPDAESAAWDLTGSFVPAISRGGLLAANGFNTDTGDAGLVLLTPSSFENLGGASRGALGDPVLSGFGTLVPGNATRLRLASARPDAVSILLASATSTPVSFVGGVLHANPPTAFVTLPTDTLGRWDLSFAWPNLPVGSSLFLQVGVLDAEATVGKALSNALLAETN